MPSILSAPAYPAGSDKTYGPTAPRGSSHSLRFLCSFDVVDTFEAVLVALRTFRFPMTLATRSYPGWSLGAGARLSLMGTLAGRVLVQTQRWRW